MEISSKTAGIDDYQPIEAIVKKHHQITINQLRWIIANKERYGLDNAIKRIGKKLYLHMPSFALWIAEQNA